ncbi:SMP-30/gluconolactonase/LRE family protein [Agromyces bauzanensis]
MSGRRIARAFTAAALTGFLALTGVTAAQAASAPPGGGKVEDLIELPNGFGPEGITIDSHGTAYVGSLADGDIYAADLHTGAGEVISEGPGTPSVGLKIDKHNRLFVAGGPSGTARVVDATTGEILASYQLTTNTSFINDVVLTQDGAWFTDSLQAQLYFVPVGPSGALPDASEIRTFPLGDDWVQVAGFNANGIAMTPDHRALLVVNSSTGTLYRVDPVAEQTIAVDLGGTQVPNGDGLLVLGRKLYVVQNQLNMVAIFEMAASGFSGRYVDALTSPEFDIPTTVAAYGNGLFLPNARFNTPPTPDTEYSVVRIDR